MKSIFSFCLLSILLLPGCSAVKVQRDYDATVDFSAFAAGLLALSNQANNCTHACNLSVKQEFISFIKNLLENYSCLVEAGQSGTANRRRSQAHGTAYTSGCNHTIHECVFP